MPQHPKCYVHIVEPDLNDVLRNSLRLAGGNMDVVAFNVMRNSVRNLIEHHLTPIRPVPREEVALYVIVGFGPMGQSLAVDLAELAHFENRKRSRLVILADNAPAAADMFLSRWGQFSPRVVVEDWNQIAFDPDCDAWACRKQRPAPVYQVDDERAIEYACNAVFAPRPHYIAERSFLNALAPLLRQSGVKPAIIVCMDREQESYSTAITLHQKLDQFHDLRPPIFVWLPKQEPLKQILEADRIPVTPFGSCEKELHLHHITDPLEEKLAMAIMADFNGLKDRAEILKRWKGDPEFFRQSNRSAATHALMALRCLGMKYVPVAQAREGGPTELTAATRAQKDVLAEMEHHRWVAERLLAGFSYGPRSDRPPRRPQVCTWEVLNSDPALKKEPEKDFRQVEVVFKTLQDLGYALVRA